MTKCIFSGDQGEYLSIYLVYERVPEEKIADLLVVCNDLNCQYKWVTYYMDEDHDIVIHNDALLTPETADEVAFELLVRLVKIAEDAKPQVMKALYV